MRSILLILMVACVVIDAYNMRGTQDAAVDKWPRDGTGEKRKYEKNDHYPYHRNKRWTRKLEVSDDDDEDLADRNSELLSQDEESSGDEEEDNLAIPSPDKEDPDDEDTLALKKEDSDDEGQDVLDPDKEDSDDEDEDE